ncbi:MAG: DUF721 domain-containing protein, partial [Acidobacteriota bacterium]|nr:DUF721 domain-containing protein [Acidobacteriota bacterium]
VRRPPDPPARLGEVLTTLAGRLRRVDLRLIDEVRRRWPEVVDTVLAQRCHPEFVKDGVLVVRVPSGAFAQRLMHESARIVAAYADLGAGAPRALRTVLEAPGEAPREA